MKYRFIGDCHGKIEAYKNLLKKYPTIQLGDLGFNYTFLADIDSDQHKFIAGNHDHHMDKYHRSHYLGDYGLYDNMFFLSGAFSIDSKYRTPGYDFFINEELSPIQLEYALKLYLESKPDIVISHDCPSIVPIRRSGVLTRYGINEDYVSNTVTCMDVMFKLHQPKFWIFGHHHKSYDEIINKTRFKCLNELEFFDFETDRKSVV